jgi:hypothetical protein
MSVDKSYTAMFTKSLSQATVEEFAATASTYLRVVAFGRCVMNKAFWITTALASTLTGIVPETALANTVVVTSVGTAYGYNGGIVDINIQGAPTQPWTTPIILYTGPNGTGNAIVTFCDDIFHNIYVPSTDTFETGIVTVDSNGGSLSQKQSGTMGLIAQIGLADFRNNNMDGAIAAQAAIWAVEYGIGNISVNSSYTGYAPSDLSNIEADFSAYTKLQYTGDSDAEGLIGVAGVQSQISGVPELSTWAMMLLGFAGLGFVSYRASCKSSAGHDRLRTSPTCA